MQILRVSIYIIIKIGGITNHLGGVINH